MTKIDKEAIQTDSKVSAMRVAFIRIIWVIITIAFFSMAAKFFFAYLEKPFDLNGIVALIGVLGTVAFGGKAIQSFSEKDAPSSITGVISSVLGGSKPPVPEKKTPADER